MSGGGNSAARLYFNCGQCGVALCDGVFTCNRSRFSTQPSCQCIFCSRCARNHEGQFNHDTFRLSPFDPIIASGRFVCSFEGCDEEISGSYYSQHQMMCSYRTLVCPQCNEWFVLTALSSHLVIQHGYNRYQLDDNNLNIGGISKGSGCIFKGREEDFVFFIAGATLYFFWLGRSPHASSQVSASSSAPPNIKLMVDLFTAQTMQKCGFYTNPPLPRSRDVVELFSFGHLTTENAFKISVMVD